MYIKTSRNVFSAAAAWLALAGGLFRVPGPAAAAGLLQGVSLRFRWNTAFWVDAWLGWDATSWELLCVRERAAAERTRPTTDFPVGKGPALRRLRSSTSPAFCVFMRREV